MNQTIEAWMQQPGMLFYVVIVITLVGEDEYQYTPQKKCFSSLFHLQILKRPEGVEGRLISHFLYLR